MFGEAVVLDLAASKDADVIVEVGLDLTLFLGRFSSNCSVSTIDLLVDLFRHSRHFHSVLPFSISANRLSLISPHVTWNDLLHIEQVTPFFERLNVF